MPIAHSRRRIARRADFFPRRPKVPYTLRGMWTLSSNDVGQSVFKAGEQRRPNR